MHRPRTLTRLATDNEREFYSGFVRSLAERRRELGYSQAALDQRLGIADGLVSKWECFIKFPSAFYLMCWAQALDVKVRTEVE